MFRRNSCRRKHAKTAAAGIIYWPRRIYGHTVLRFFRFKRNTIVVAVFRLIMNRMEYHLWTNRFAIPGNSDENTIVVAVFRLIINQMERIYGQTVLRFRATRREGDRGRGFQFDYEPNGISFIS